MLQEEVKEINTSPCEKERVEGSYPAFTDRSSVKSDTGIQQMMAIDMLLSSIDISYFALPFVIQKTGWFLTLGFFV